MLVFFAAAMAAWTMPPKVTGLRCQAQVEKTVKSLKPRKLWYKNATNEFRSGYLHKAPTKRLGYWVRVDVSSSKPEAVVSYTSPNSVTKFVFDEKCRVKKKRLKRQFPQIQDKRVFNDKMLKELVEGGTTGVIYAWSPAQIYSSQYFHRFVRAAQDLDIRFEAVLDPQATQREAVMTATANGFPLEDRRMIANELLELGMSTHYPSTLIFHKGLLSRWPIVGLLKPADLRADMKKEINRLDRIARAKKKRKKK